MQHRSPADINFRVERTALDLLVKRLVSSSNFVSGGYPINLRSRIQRGLYVQTDEKRLAALLDELICLLRHDGEGRPVEITGTTMGSMASLSISSCVSNTTQLQSGVLHLVGSARSLGIDLRFGSPSRDKVAVQCILPLCHPLTRA